MQDGGRLEQAGIKRVDQTVFRADFACEDEVFAGQGFEKALDLPGRLEESPALVEPLFGPPEGTLAILDASKEDVGAELAGVDAEGDGLVVEVSDRDEALEMGCGGDCAPIQTRDAIAVHILRPQAKD